MGWLEDDFLVSFCGSFGLFSGANLLLVSERVITMYPHLETSLVRVLDRKDRGIIESTHALVSEENGISSIGWHCFIRVTSFLFWKAWWFLDHLQPHWFPKINSFGSPKNIPTYEEMYIFSHPSPKDSWELDHLVQWIKTKHGDHQKKHTYIYICI